jgi:hypothetical protein
VLRLARDFAPFYGVAVLYEALAQLTPSLRPDVVDAALIRIDHAWLGVATPPLWLETVRVAVAVVGASRSATGRTSCWPPRWRSCCTRAASAPCFANLMLAGVLDRSSGVRRLPAGARRRAPTPFPVRAVSAPPARQRVLPVVSSG